MNGKKEITNAEKLRQKRTACWIILLSDVVILWMLPKELLMETLHRLQRMGLANGLRFMWETNRSPLFGLAIFAALEFVIIVCLLCISSLSRRIAREPDNVPVNSPARPGTPQTAKGSAAMNKKPASKNTGLVILGVVAAIMISAAAEDPDAIIPAVITIGVVAAIVGVVKAMNKEKAGKTGKKTNVELHRPFPQPTVVKTKQTPRAFRHKDEAEEVMTCAHHTGKEKYLEQVEGFYRNGLIDRAEYKALREKYEKMDIPEDYH